MKNAIARFDKQGKGLLLTDHLYNVGHKCSNRLLSLLKSKLPKDTNELSIGLLIGYLHDIGKCSSVWQNYLFQSHFFPGSVLKKIPHAKYGSYYLIDKFLFRDDNIPKNKKRLLIELCSMIIYGHHSGMSDMISFETEEYFIDNLASGFKDISKPELDIYKDILNILDKPFMDEIERLFYASLDELGIIYPNFGLMQNKQQKSHFWLDAYYWLRIFQSILIDADREDSMESVGDFVVKSSLQTTENGDVKVKKMISVFEKNLAKKSKRINPLQKLREEVSLKCLSSSFGESGIHRLTVPTGGGKTFASLRYALHHAHLHNKERIIYVIPYTSVIAQNVKATRWIMDCPVNGEDDFILEHHCNYCNDFIDKSDFDKEKLSKEHEHFEETWDMPIIFTTGVQFMNTVFSQSNTDARRMTRLSNAVIIFDEVQTFPHKVHNLFNTLLNFIKDNMNSEILLCTATQPLLNNVVKRSGKNYAVPVKIDGEVISNYQHLFANTQRATITLENDPMSVSDIVEKSKQNALIKDIYRDGTICAGSAMVIANSKEHTLYLYKEAKNDVRFDIYHLSTSMYVGHRNRVIDEIVNKLQDKKREKPLLLFTTPLIEAGVDIDFGCVIRCKAGFVSIKQSEGRCNRENEKTNSRIFIVQPDLAFAKKNPPSLSEDIFATNTTFDHCRGNSSQYNGILDEKLVNYYYHSLYSGKCKEFFDYPIDEKHNIIELISDNSKKAKSYGLKTNNKSVDCVLRGSYREAQKAFRLIDDFSCSAIVECAESKSLIDELKNCTNKKELKKLLRKSSSFQITFTPSTREKLISNNSLLSLRSDIEIEYVVENSYHNSYGLMDDYQNFIYI